MGHDADNLGDALQVLGERESGTARLEEAVVACRAALLEWTRELVPLNWAMRRPISAMRLEARGAGERDGATEEAAAAYRAALSEWTRDKVPLNGP